jgi:hypothetical protein
MKLGILADIHEHLEYLQCALDQFCSHGVDQVIVLGDVYMKGLQLLQTVELLRQANAIGVWGNHDLGLCRDPSERTREKHAGPVLDYMSTLQPRLAVEECLFTHVDPWLDPQDPLQIWWFESFPDEPGVLQRSFDAVPQRHLFVGHYHRWMLLTPEGRSPWQGKGPIVLHAPRTFVIVHSVHAGHCAEFDTVTRLLTPVALG